MKEDKEFDKYINKLFDEQKNVPAELKWDAMDFDLPKVEKEEKNKKFIFLLLFLMVMISSAYIYTNLFGTNRVSSTNLTRKNIESNQNELMSVGGATEKTESVTSSKLAETMTLDDVSNRLDEISNKLDNVSNRLDNVSKKARELNSNPLNKDVKNNTTSISEIISTKNIRNEVTKSASPLASEKINKSIIQKSEVEYVQNIPALLINEIENNSTFATIDTIDFNTLLEMKDEEDNKIKLKMRDFSVGFGSNSFFLNPKNLDSNILANKVSGSIGKSFRLGTRINLKGHWNLNLIAKYDQYHSTFEHERSLNPDYDIQRLVRIETQEITFHNNYTHALGLQLGVERYWDLSIFQIYVNAGISPTYILSASGKTTFDTEVEPLMMDTNTKKVSLSRNFGVGILYPINSVFNIGLDYQYSKFFSEGIFINHNIFANQQSSLSINFTYKFSQ